MYDLFKDYLPAINHTKKNLMDSDDPMLEKKYPAYMVNKVLSGFQDTVMLVNEMNRNHFLDRDMQFQFLLNSITKKKRFSKWSKKDDESESILLVKEYFGYSSEKAKEALKILSVEQLNTIREKINKGGK